MMELVQTPIQKRQFFRALTLLYIISTFLTKVSDGLIVEEEFAKYECLEGFVGLDAIPADFKKHMADCGFDKAQPLECKKHCLAKRLGIIVDGRVWLYKLAIALKLMFPTPLGRDSWDKLIDVMLECTDVHYKANGPLTPFHCYREKKMWACIVKAVEKICQNNHRHQIEALKNKERTKRKHQDQIVDEEAGENAEDQENSAKEKSTKSKQLVLGDY